MLSGAAKLSVELGDSAVTHADSER